MDKDTLLGDLRPTKEIEVPGKGTMTIRALSRMELMLGAKPADSNEQEQMLLAWAVVDPVLTRADVKRWQETSVPGEVAAVMIALRDLSGIEAGADKAAAKSVPR